MKTLSPAFFPRIAFPIGDSVLISPFKEFPRTVVTSLNTSTSSSSSNRGARCCLIPLHLLLTHRIRSLQSWSSVPNTEFCSHFVFLFLSGMIFKISLKSHVLSLLWHLPAALFEAQSSGIQSLRAFSWYHFLSIHYTSAITAFAKQIGRWNLVLRSQSDCNIQNAGSCRPLIFYKNCSKIFVPLLAPQEK